MSETTFPASIRTSSQKRTFSRKFYERAGFKVAQGRLIVATVRWGDDCGNGHNTFSITGEITSPDGKRFISGGCIHEEIARFFPKLAPYLKWHLCGSNGPLHYLANTLYLAGDRDHNGLRAGETRQLRNGKTGQLCWKLEKPPAKLPEYVDADACPSESYTVKYVPWMIEGKGKAMELDAARRAAIWPDATDAELWQEPDALKAALLARLPALMAEFKSDMESLGFTY
jgi:hypothetical protein